MKIIVSLLLLIGLLQADIIRDDNSEVVIDTYTNLMWQDDVNASTVTKNWSDSIDYCEGLYLGGYNDWHLPSINELFSLVDKSKFYPTINSVFQNINSAADYWTSTSYNVEYFAPFTAWYISFYAGNNNANNKSYEHNVRCVRTDAEWANISDPLLDIDQADSAELPSMVIDSSDKLYVSWTEDQSSDVYYHVKMFDPANGTWQSLGANINTEKAPISSKAIIKLDTTDNLPYIYYYFDNSISDRGHKVKKWDGTSWNEIYSDGVYGPENYNMDINTTSGYPTIVYKSNVNVFHFRSYDGTAWIDNSFNQFDRHLEVSNPTLLLNGSKPYLIYNYTDGYGHSEVRDYDGTDWIFLGNLESNITDRQAKCPSSIIDRNGNLVVAYVETNTPNTSGFTPSLYVKRYDGTAWSIIGDTINGNTSVYSSNNQCISLVEEKSTGYLYVAWSNETNNKINIYTSKYDGTNWSKAAPSPIEEDHSVREPSMVINSSGQMNIAVMYDSTPNQTDMDDIRVYRSK